MSKILDTINFEKSALTDTSITDDNAVLTFGDTVIELSDWHDQDCCEHVYADWSALKAYLPQLTNQYTQLVIKGVKGEGILLSFNYSSYRDADPLEKVFIPCYNEQNGYYSDDLSICVKRGDIEKKIEITAYKEDRID